MKKRVAIILAFVLALSTFGILGSACTTPSKEDVNAVLAADVFQIAKDAYKQLSGKELPAVVADKLNAELYTKLAKGTGFLGITTYVCNLIAEYTGYTLNAETLALLIKAAFAVYGLVA